MKDKNTVQNILAELIKRYFSDGNEKAIIYYTDLEEIAEQFDVELENIEK